MQLIVIGSNSSGNGYILQADNGDQLLIEAGRPLSDFRRIGGLKLASAKGMIISHEHGDHAKYIGDFLKAGVSVGSTESLHDRFKPVKALKHGKSYRYGSFTVTPFTVKHDVPCLGYLIYHKECGTVFFATDCYDLSVEIHGIKHFLMEANYQDDMLQKAVELGKTPQAQADRVRLSHMSLSNAVAWLKRCDAEDSAHTITLIHTSMRHLSAGNAVKTMERYFSTPTFVAAKGTTINLL